MLETQLTYEISLASRQEPKGSSPIFPLRFLPFTRDEFEQVTNLFPLHGDTARIIDRKDVAFFCDIDLTDTSGPEKAICLSFSFHL